MYIGQAILCAVSCCMHSSLAWQALRSLAFSSLAKIHLCLGLQLAASFVHLDARFYEEAFGGWLDIEFCFGIFIARKDSKGKEGRTDIAGVAG